MPTPSIAIDLDQFTTFGDLLKFLRRRAGLTQRELSIAVGYSVPQISRLEQNQRLPDLAMIGARIVPALDLDDQPKIAARLLALAEAMRREDAPAPGLPPYKGLLHFDEADAELFFGREALVDRLVARVTGPIGGPLRFLAVVGASGSGKSSLVRAGLVPALRWRPGSAGWPVAVFTPTAHPFEALAACLNADGRPSPASIKLADELARQPHALRQRLSSQLPASAAAPAAFLLIVDQFEELFTLCRDEAEQAAFVDRLLSVAAEPAGLASVVIALRADFYAQCGRFDGLREALPDHQEYIGPMTADELRRAIEEPARRGRWELEPGLVDLLLGDVGVDGSRPPEPGALPLLSHALLETWQRRRGQTLTLSGYAASGGVRGAIAETAEAVFHDQLDPNQRAIARQIFLRLTELGEDGVTADTRRRVAFTELMPEAAGAPAVREVLQALADARLITTEQDGAEVAHEALIREWPTLRGWLEEDREGLRLHRQLTEAALEWHRLGREPGALYRGAKLAQAREWSQAPEHEQALNGLEREYLAASTAESEREAAEREAARQRELEAARKLAETEAARASAETERAAAAQQLAHTEKQRADDQARATGLLRRRALYLLGALVVAVILAAAAVYFGNRATQIATAAQDASRLATARELAADSVTNLDVDPERSVLLALQAVLFGDTPETEGALHQAVMADRLQLTLVGHQAEVYGIAYSADGQRVATASGDHTARIWDAATGHLLLTLSGHTDSVNGVAFSPDNSRIATASDDHSARVWDASTGRELFTLRHGNLVWRVAFSPDGQRLATTSSDGSTIVWDSATGQQILSLQNGGVPFVGVAYSPDGTRLATTILFGPTQIWDAATGKLLRTLANDAGLESRAIAFSPDGKSVAVAIGAQAKVWDVGSGQLLLTLSGHTNVVRAVAFSPDGKLLATGSIDRKVIVWDVATGRQLYTLAGHANAINGEAFSPDGQHLATASWDYTGKVWNLTPPSELLSLAAPALIPGSNAVLALSPNGTRVIVSTNNDSAQVFDTTSGRDLLTLPWQSDPITSLSYSGDGTRIATSSSNLATDGQAVVWDAISGKPLETLSQVSIYAMAVNFDGTQVATGADFQLQVRDLTKQKTLWTHADTGRFFQSLAYSPDGSRLAVSANASTSVTQGVVNIWDAASGRLLMTLSGDSEEIKDVTFNHDGTRLATASDDGTAKIWDAASGKLLLTLAGHTAIVEKVAFNADGTRLATASLDGTARIWDTTSGQQLLTLYGDSTEMDDVAFSPDGTRLYTVTDQALRVYALRLADLVALAKARVTRPLTPAECQQYIHQNTCPAP